MKTKKIVRWTFTWRGGESHASGADGTVMIPLVLYPRITPEKLVEWMKERLLLPSSIIKGGRLELNPIKSGVRGMVYTYQAKIWTEAA